MYLHSRLVVCLLVSFLVLLPLVVSGQRPSTGGNVNSGNTSGSGDNNAKNKTNNTTSGNGDTNANNKDGGNNNNNNNPGKIDKNNNPTTNSDSKLSTNQSDNNSTDLISDDGQNSDGIPRFLWPMPIQSQPWWQIPTIPVGTEKYALNASWTLENLNYKPKRLTLQYGIGNNPQLWTNISTEISFSTTKFNWSPPLGIQEDRNYRLRLIDSNAPAPGDRQWQGITSGSFVVYVPTNLLAIANLPQNPYSSSLCSIDSVTRWIALIMASIVSVFLIVT